MRSRLRVACALVSGRIYAGRVKASGIEWREPKEDVTSDVLKAVIEYTEPGHYIDVEVDGTPKYRISIEELK